MSSLLCTWLTKHEGDVFNRFPQEFKSLVSFNYHGDCEVPRAIIWVIIDFMNLFWKNIESDVEVG